MGGSPSELSEELVDAGEAKEGLKLILQAFRHFTYVTAHSPTLPSLYLRHSPFSNPSVASPTSQFILQPLFRFSCVTSSSLYSPGEPPMIRTCARRCGLVVNMSHYHPKGPEFNFRLQLIENFQCIASGTSTTQRSKDNWVAA